MKQQWGDLLFLHWEVDYDEMRALIPPELEIDTFQGKAYIALVPFDMKGVTGRGCPAPPALSDFPEFNVRTYVKKDGKPGVWFFSLDITNGLAVWAARNIFHLSYRKAEMSYQAKDKTIHFTSHYSEAETFAAEYTPLQKITPFADSFDHWATERYCLYTRSSSGKLYRGEVQHPKWDLYTAEVSIHKNTMLDTYTIGEMTTPLFCSKIPVVVFPLEKI